jgi:hypothetical protein
MKHTNLISMLTAALLIGAAAAHAQNTASAPVIYPAKGQSAKQQDQDRYECHSWARGQSGFDPTQAAQAAPTPAPATPSGTTTASSGAPVSGMAAGAMGGAAVAELTHHNAGHGAAPVQSAAR